MEERVVLTYVSIEKGLIYKTSSHQPLKLDSIVGKTVKVESVEQGFLLIDGKYFEIVGLLQGLVHVKEVQ